jgi:hypothetical protein
VKSAVRTATPKRLSFLPNMSENSARTREDIKTWFEAIELDDYLRFGGKA